MLSILPQTRVHRQTAFALVLLTLVTLGQSATAQKRPQSAVSSAYVNGQWLGEAIPQDSRTHDFGTVARAAKTEHRFFITNPLDQPIHLQSVRASCGCTTPFIETEWIQPGEQGSILARFNTDTFTGNRKATLTVSIDQPSYTELQLQVRGYIRSDVVLHPGELQFGQIPEGEGKTIEVSLDYAGRSDWEVTEVTSELPFVDTKLEQIARDSGRVSYQITATLKEDAPVGFVRNQLVLHTNDRRLTSLPLPLTADIQPSLQVRPQEFELGELKAGESVQQRLVIKGRKAFRVLSITSNEVGVQFTPAEEAKLAHVINLKFEPAADADGETRGKLILQTDLSDEPLELELSYSTVKRID